MAERSMMDSMMEIGPGSCVIMNGASCDNICSESTCIAANYCIPLAQIVEAKVQLLCFSISKIRTQI